MRRKASDESVMFGRVLGGVAAYMRIERGLSQAALADRLGLLQSQVSRIEAGRIPDVMQYQRLAESFGTDTGTLTVLVNRIVARVESTTAFLVGKKGVGYARTLPGFSGLIEFVVAVETIDAKKDR